MSQRFMSKIIYDVPKSLQTRAQRNLPEVAKIWTAEARRVLGVQGSRRNRSRPGQAPRRQTGELEKGTRAIPAASKLEIQLVTTMVGKILNGGTRDGRIKPRPFINRITNAVRQRMREALFAR